MSNSTDRGASDLSAEARKQLVGKLRIKYPARASSLAVLERCLADSKHSTEPKCAFVGGVSGAGKSSLIQDFLNAHPKVKGGEVDRTPVLVASLPSSASRKDAASKLLQELGDPRAFRGPLNQLTHRLLEYLQLCGVEMVVLDEFQHLIDSDSQKVLSKTADWIKELVNESNIPFALVGMPEAVRIFDANPQLSRRFTRRILIERFGWAPGMSSSDLAMLLNMLDEGLPFPMKAGLDHPETVKWFHHHTEGILGRIMNIVREAAHFAIDKGADRIGKDDLLAALAQMTIDMPPPPAPNRSRRGRRGPEANIGDVLRA